MDSPENSDLPHKDFADRLRIAMGRLGVDSDAEIKSHLREWFDVSPEAPRKWIVGAALPKTKRIFDISSRCGVTADWLAHGVGEPEFDRRQLDEFQSYIREVRAKNLRQWIDEDPSARGNVSKWCDFHNDGLSPGERPFSPGHIRQLVPRNGPAHGQIGEQLARKIERAVGKPVGSLDIDHDVSNSPPLIKSSSTSFRERALYAATPSQLALIDVVLGLEPRTHVCGEAIDLVRMASRLTQRVSDE